MTATKTKTILVAALAALTLSTSIAEERWQIFTGDGPVTAYRVDPAQKWFLSSPPRSKGDKRLEAVYDFSYERDSKGVNILYPIDGARVQIKLNEAARLRSYSIECLSSELIKAAGYDRMSVDVEGGSLAIKSHMNGKQKIDKKKNVSPAVLDMQCMNQTLQAMLQSGIAASFKTDVHIQGGDVYRMKFELMESSDPLLLSAKYDYPDAFKQAIKPGRSYRVYVLSLEPPAALVFPHRFYFVYDTQRDHSFCAYWGGKPDEAEFQARLFSEEGR